MSPTGKEKSTNTKNRGILRLLRAPGRYIKCKIKGFIENW